MGTELHKGKFSGRVGYALFSTVTMSYRTRFMPRKSIKEELEKRGYNQELIKKLLRKPHQLVKARKHKGKSSYEISFPVYVLSGLKGKPKKRKSRKGVLTKNL